MSIPILNGIKCSKLVHISCNISGKDSSGDDVGDGDDEQGEGGETHQPLVLIGSVKQEDPSEIDNIIESNDAQEQGCCNTMFINNPELYNN